MANPCKNCANCLTTTIGTETRFWCKEGAFDFAHVPADHELDFEYMQSICSSYESMDDKE